MGKTTRLMALPTQMLEVALGSKRRRKRMAVVGGITVCLLGAGAWYGLKTLEEHTAAALAADVGSLETCVLGDPLAEGETAAERARGIQLGQAGVPRPARAKPGELPWPQRCGTFASAIADKLGTEDALGAAMTELAAALKKEGENIEEPVAKAFAAISSQGIVGVRQGSVEAAPKPLAPRFSRIEFAKLPTLLGGNFALSSVRFEPRPSGKLRFLVDEAGTGGPWLCSLGPAEATAECRKLDEAASKQAGRLSIVGSTNGTSQPALFAAQGTLGVFDATIARSGEPTPPVFDATKSDKGLFVLTREPEGDVKVQRLAAVAPSGQPAPNTLPITVAPRAELTQAGEAALLWERVAYQGQKGVDTTAHLLVRDLGPTGPTGVATDLGALSDPAPSADAAKKAVVDGCQSPGGELAAVVVRGAKSDQVSVFAGGRWSAVFTAATRGGQLVCHANEVTLTEIQHGADNGADSSRNLARVKQSRCAAGCTTTEVKLAELLSETDVIPADLTSFAATDIGGKLGLVSNAAKNGVRLRIGAPGALLATKEDLLFDGFEQGDTKQPSFNGMVLVPFAGRALLLLATRSGIRAFRIDADGKVVPIAATIAGR